MGVMSRSSEEQEQNHSARDIIRFKSRTTAGEPTVERHVTLTCFDSKGRKRRDRVSPDRERVPTGSYHHGRGLEGAAPESGEKEDRHRKVGEEGPEGAVPDAEEEGEEKKC